MRRVFSWCAALAALILAMSQQVRAQDQTDLLSGTYAFTLAEKCVHQLNANTPGFGTQAGGPFAIADTGAHTYGGASDGIMLFDGNGGVRLELGRATNIMNDASMFLGQGKVPLGFGFGPALPFRCNGKYAVTDGRISVNLTCMATVPPNPMVLGFSSTFSMEGFFPLGRGGRSHLLLTDIGNAVQPVTIFLVGGGSVMQQRVCTRSTTLVFISE